MKKVLEKVKKLFKGIFSDTKKSVVAILVVLVGIILISGLKSSLEEKRKKEEALKRAEEYAQSLENTPSNTESQDGRNDAYLITIQEDLIATYGELPEGYVWDVDGSILSLGDKSLTAEDVIYSYLNGLRTLDLSMAQKYSRNSTVVSTYQSYFDSSDLSSDYYDSFIRNMYKEVMLSIQVVRVVDTTIFAENKQVFTIELTVLDLTNKNFWEEDKEEIYNNLYIYHNDENDSTKSEMYLYDYVLNYYRSDEAVTRNVTINLTVEKYPDLDTGWLVSIDKDLNDICSYTDGTLMVNYINRMYMQEGADYVEEMRGTEESTEEVVEEVSPVEEGEVE